MSARWLAASKIAGLPGMPSTARGTLARATREGWPSRPRRGRGGGRVFLVPAQPEAGPAPIAEPSSPPPMRTPTPEQVEAWLDQVEAKLREFEAQQAIERERYAASLLQMSAMEHNHAPCPVSGPAEPSAPATRATNTRQARTRHDATGQGASSTSERTR
jgi:putative transposase